jgi:23S rRNA (guanosine2251-2'-O)-methyltransferase
MKQPMIFGIRPILEAIDERKSIDKVFLKTGMDNPLGKELMQKLRKHDIPYQIVPYQRLNRFTRKNHQGAIALISPVEFSRLDELVTMIYEKGEDPLIVLLDGVTDVRNFGAIVRSAECLGAHAVAMPFKGSAAVGPDAVKTSAGALLRLPLCKVESTPKACKELQQAGLKVVAMTEKAKGELAEIDLNGPLAIVMGAEDVGVSDEVLRTADDLARIPMSGNIGSLNVSVSAGISLYEVHRQRKTQNISMK